MWVVTRSPCETCVDSPSAMGLPSGVRRTRKPWDTPSLYRTATDSAISAVDERREGSKRKRSRSEQPRMIHSNIGRETTIVAECHNLLYVERSRHSLHNMRLEYGHASNPHVAVDPPLRT